MRSLRDAVVLVLLAAAPFAAPLGLLQPSFVRPWGLALYALAVPLILLHMLRPRRTPRTVGSVLLWQEVERALDARHPFERLRRNIPLFLELLVVAGLAVALATPRFRGGAGTGRDCVIVLDASASMKTRDATGAQSRFEVARADARARVRGLRSGERACVILATPRGARTAQGWTEDVNALDDALRAVEASDGGADLGDALVLAAAAARTLGENAEVVLFSDGGGGAALPALGFKGKLRYRPLGSSDENLGVVAAELRSEERGATVLVSVLNAGARPRRAFVELLSPQRAPLAAREVTLAPHSRAALVLEADLLPGPVLARVSAADGGLDHLAADDEATLIVPERGGGTVALVGSSRVLERALGAAHVRVAAQVEEETRLAVFAGAAPEKLPDVSCLIVGPKANVGPIQLGEVLEQPRIAGWDRDDRLLRFVSFDEVEVKRARRLILGPGARPLVSTDQGPLIATWSDGETLRVVVGFDLADTSWPLRLGFPIFIRNCVLAALEDESLGPSGTVRAGSVLSLHAKGAAEVTVVTPAGREVRAPVEDGRALFADTDQNGLYRVRLGARESIFGVATLDPGETSIATAPIDVGGDKLVGVAALEAGEREVVAPFLLVALVAAALEAFAFHRRW